MHGGSKPVASPDFLTGGGRSGALVRTLDWSRTSLGAMATWPESLRTAVALGLSSPLPALMGFGPDLTLFHNDAAAAILDDRHSDLLGQSLAAAWPEVWETLEHPINAALGGETRSTLLSLAIRRGVVGSEAVFECTTSPVRTGSGEVVGFFATLIETTQERIGEWRLQFLLDLGDKLRGLTSPVDVTTVASAALGRYLGAARAGYGVIDLSQEVVSVKRDWTRDDTVASLAGEARVLDAFGPAVIAELKAGGTLVVEDCYTDSRAGNAYAATWDSIGCRSLIVVPLIKGARLRAVLYVHEAAPRRWSTAEIALAEAVAERTWEAHERARIEAASRESEARFRNMADHAPVMMWVTDPSGFCTYLNRRWYDFTGQVDSEAIGYGWLDAAHPDDRDGAEATFRNANAERAPFSAEFRLRRADGTYRWVIDSASPRFSESGEHLGYVGSVIDIDERREAEERLRESEAKFQVIANSIDQMVWSTRPDGFHDFYNQRWYDYTGVPRGTTDGEGWTDMIHADDQERTWSSWRHSLATGEPYQIEYRLRHRSGQYRWALGRALPVRDEAGRITRWFGTCTDIQEIVEAREVLARSRDALEAEIATRTAERDSIWQNSNELMAVFGFDGRRKAVNPAWTRVLGHHESTLLGTDVPDLTHPDDRLRLREAVHKLAKDEIVVEFEDRMLHADGSYRSISWTGVPGDGVFYAIGRDVTQQRKAEEALRQAQKMEAVGQLTGGVAHDFNNLLTIIRSSTDLLRRPDLAEERRRRYIDAISDTVDRASKLTGQLLAFARRQALKPEVFDVGERIGSITDMLRTIMGARITIATEITCEQRFIEADVAQFETALVNMAVNARDAMNDEGTLTVRVEELPHMPAIRGHAGGSGRFVAVSLTDTGSGILPEQIAHIFEPFFTTKEVGKGTGLGLSQVYGFAKQSGGDVDVRSEIGRGTTFTLYLPQAEYRPARDDKPPGATRYGPADSGRGQRVLVVEDNIEVGRFSTQILQDLGYQTTWAANATEALALLDEGLPFDVVFSDVVMPGMTGVELGQEIRRRFPSLPVILTSGYSHVLAEEGRHGFELLQKPYAVEELSRVFRRVIRTSARC